MLPFLCISLQTQHTALLKEVLSYLIYHCFQNRFHCILSPMHAAKHYYSVASPPASLPYGLAVSLLLLTVLVN